MTAYNGAAPAHGLAVALFWWPVAVVLALDVFHRHHAELPRQGAAGGGHAGILLIPLWKASRIVIGKQHGGSEHR